MTNNNCSLCGMVCYQGKDLCETCGEYSNDIPQIEDKNPEYQTSHETNINSFSQNNHANSFRGNNQNFRNNSQPIRQEFQSDTKDGALQFLWDLSFGVKFFIGFVIFCIGFAFILRFAINNADFTTTKTDTDKTATFKVDPEEISPWFSSWFRSYPTGEEIFDKFEDVTSAQGTKTFSKTFEFNGTAAFLPPVFSEAHWDLSLKETQIENREKFNNHYFANFTNGNESLNKDGIMIPTGINVVKDSKGNFKFNDKKQNELFRPGVSRLDMGFAISMKEPNKMLMNMSLGLRGSGNNSPVVQVFSGNDGDNAWSYIVGQKGSKSVPQSDGFSLGLGKSSLGTSLTFPKMLFKEIKFIEETVVLRRKTYKVDVVDTKNEACSFFFDQETALVIKVDCKKKMIMHILKYKQFSGSKHPSKIIFVYKNKTPPLLMQINSLKKDMEIEDKVFQKSNYLIGES